MAGVTAKDLLSMAAEMRRVARPDAAYSDGGSDSHDQSQDKPNEARRQRSHSSPRGEGFSALTPSVHGTVASGETLEAGSEMDSLMLYSGPSTVAGRRDQGQSGETSVNSLGLTTCNVPFPVINADSGDASELAVSSLGSFLSSERPGLGRSSSTFLNAYEPKISIGTAESSQGEQVISSHSFLSMEDQKNSSALLLIDDSPAKFVATASQRGDFVPRRFDKMRALLVNITPLQLEALVLELFAPSAATSLDSQNSSGVPPGWTSACREAGVRKFRPEARLGDMSLAELVRFCQCVYEGEPELLDKLAGCTHAEAALDLIAVEFERMVSTDHGGEGEHDSGLVLQIQDSGSAMSDSLMDSVAAYNASDGSVSDSSAITNLRVSLRACSLPELRVVAERLGLDVEEDGADGLSKAELIARIEDSMPEIASASRGESEEGNERLKALEEEKRNMFNNEGSVVSGGALMGEHRAPIDKHLSLMDEDGSYGYKSQQQYSDEGYGEYGYAQQQQQQQQHFPQKEDGYGYDDNIEEEDGYGYDDNIEEKDGYGCDDNIEQYPLEKEGHNYDNHEQPRSQQQQQQYFEEDSYSSHSYSIDRKVQFTRNCKEDVSHLIPKREKEDGEHSFIGKKNRKNPRHPPFLARIRSRLPPWWFLLILLMLLIVLAVLYFGIGLDFLKKSEPDEEAAEMWSDLLQPDSKKSEGGKDTGPSLDLVSGGIDSGSFLAVPSMRPSFPGTQGEERADDDVLASLWAGGMESVEEGPRPSTTAVTDAPVPSPTAGKEERPAPGAFVTSLPTWGASKETQIDNEAEDWGSLSDDVEGLLTDPVWSSAPVAPTDRPTPGWFKKPSPPVATTIAPIITNVQTMAPSPLSPYPLLGPYTLPDMRLVLFGIPYPLSHMGRTQWHMLTAAYVEQFFNEPGREGTGDAIQNIVFDVEAEFEIDAEEPLTDDGRRELQSSSGVVVTFVMIITYRTFSSFLTPSAVAVRPFFDGDIRAGYVRFLEANNAAAHIGAVTGVSAIFYPGEEVPYRDEGLAMHLMPIRDPPSPTSKPTPKPTLKPTPKQTAKPTAKPTSEASPVVRCSASARTCTFVAGAGISAWFTQEIFDKMFPNLCANGCEDACTMLTYPCLIQATLAYPTFASSGNRKDDMRELAAWLGIMGQGKHSAKIVVLPI